MLRFVTHRVLIAIPTLFLIVTLSFFLIRLAPGGPFHLERPLDARIMANLEQLYHLDRPLWRQYLDYLSGLVRGDFGPSFVFRDFSVADLIRAGLPTSVQIGSAALALALAVGLLLGAVAALHQNRSIDYAVIGAATFGLTVPTFVFAPVVSLIFGVWLRWLPPGGWGDGALANRILPIVTLALPQIAIITRLTRGSMIEALRSNHIRTARANGLNWRRVVVNHALRGAVLPVISYLGPAAAALLTGSVVVETIFQIPGIGRYFVSAALARDYTLVMGTVIIVAAFVLAFNLLVDVLYAALDPRVRYD